MLYTKQDLINAWFKLYPNDIDFEFNAIAGYEELKNGMFILYKEYIHYKEL